jgi:hypothetical protein
LIRAIFIILPAVLVMTILLAVLYGKKKKTGLDDDFMKALSGLDIKFQSYYNKMIAAGLYRDHPVYFYYIAAARNELLPLTHEMAIVCGMKIPGGKEARMHLVAMKEQGASPLREAVGWMNPDPGFFLAADRKGSREESLRLYRKLSHGARNGLSEFATRLGSAALVADWLDVIVGRKNSLKMYSGAREELPSLELQVKVPFNIKSSDLAATLDEMKAVIDLVSKDLEVPD